jgi:hypothetical protein
VKKTRKLRALLQSLRLIHALKILLQKVVSPNHLYANPVLLDRYAQMFVNHCHHFAKRIHRYLNVDQFLHHHQARIAIHHILAGVYKVLLQT